MADTIEWLETIGMNARLRHAPTEELADTLAQTDASDALKEAVISRDRSRLSAEFGEQHLKTEHSTTGPSHEEPDHDDDQDMPSPKPDQDGSSHDR
jgi:hypothetical protein